jgi:hypothetical protein
VIRNDHFGLAALLDDGRQLTGDTNSGDRSIGHRHQALPRYVIDDVEDTEAPATGELVMDEVERSASIDLGLNQDLRSAAMIVQADARPSPAHHVDERQRRPWRRALPFF